MNTAFPPTRAAGLARLNQFLPHAGWDYARTRNFDRSDSTARLSPWLRHRLITESEVVAAVLPVHGAQSAEKFIQEVFWRSYWKGWLEQRPGVWADYRAGVRAGLNRVQTESGLRAAYHGACLGQTGIACFDHWAQELADTGYLHNHARMWFASIWIFTLRLPWALGADLFLRQLIDGDAASNTLSWRWVAGVQTQGKHYLATAHNIAQFTDGRFNPVAQLVENAVALDGSAHPELSPLPAMQPAKPGLRTGVLLHDEDLSLHGSPPEGPTATLNASAHRSPLAVAPCVAAFAEGALGDAMARLGQTATATKTADDIAAWARNHDLQQIALPHAPTGPVRDVLTQLRALAPDLALAEHRSPWDGACWPHATKGFFPFRKQIPRLIELLITPSMSH